MKKVHILGGGTTSYIDSHLALCAPAFGTTARLLTDLCKAQSDKLEVVLHLTRMAGGDKSFETVGDLAQLMNGIKADPETKIVFMNVAVCDFQAIIGKRHIGSGLYSYTDETCGKDAPRLSTHDLLRLDASSWPHLRLRPYGKLIGHTRRGRKDIFLVGFKQTAGANPEEQYVAGLNLLKEASCNLVLANDTKTRLNMVITPEEAKYHVTTDRTEALKGLVEIAYLRSHLTFTRSTVVDGEAIPWNSELVPASLRTVVDYCIEKGAYKPFRGATVGHFACKVNDTTFLTSKRKTNFNDLNTNGLVKVKTDGPDSVIAYGSKPSVGGQSQRIVFTDHKDYDCIVHAHVPIKPGSKVPTVSQREYECGSHECGANTSRGLAKFGNLSAVYLDNHGPNIVFNRSIDPQEVIRFIYENFDLSEKTGGPVSLGQILKTPDTLDSLIVTEKATSRQGCPVGASKKGDDMQYINEHLQLALSQALQQKEEAICNQNFDKATGYRDAADCIKKALNLLPLPEIWTEEQVIALNASQADESHHPYTCGNDSRHRPLLATKQGWKCLDCSYRQFWSHQTGGKPG